MTKEDLKYFKDWFSDYCKTFYTSNDIDDKNITLKERHTYNVCSNIIEIAEDMLIEDQILIAETVALFHDIGRFPQYIKYKTFMDRDSENHGVLGSKVLQEHGILNDIPTNEKDIIIKTVRFHNAFKLPAKEDKETKLFLKLLRDADKLDIWRVFIDHYKLPEEEKASAIELGLTDTSDYSRDLLSYILDRQIVPLSRVTTLNDYRIMQLSWVFDLNFESSLKVLLKRKYVDTIVSHLPRADEIKRTADFLKKLIYKKLKTGRLSPVVGSELI